MDGGAVEAQWLEYGRGWSFVWGEVIGEILLTIYVNGQEFASIKVVHGAKAQKSPFFLPAPGEVELRPVPGKTKEIASVIKLVIPAGGDGDGPGSVKSRLPAAFSAGILRVKAERPEARKVDHLTCELD